MDDHGVLDIQVVDQSGDLMPCRLHIKQADGSCWVPADGVNPECSETEAPDLLLPVHYNRYLHVCHGVDLQSVHLNHGSATLSIPAGELTLMLARGHEFIPISDSFEIKSGARLHKKYVLRRGLDLPSIGWYGGYAHTFLPLGTPGQLCLVAATASRRPPRGEQYGV